MSKEFIAAVTIVKDRIKLFLASDVKPQSSRNCLTVNTDCHYANFQPNRIYLDVSRQDLCLTLSVINQSTLKIHNLDLPSNPVIVIAVGESQT